MNAYFAGGCFWCMEKPYHTIPGVRSAVSGYCGGSEENPKYEDVKAQKTHHRETVCVTFDENAVTFETLLEVYLQSIDPFDAGGQFIDRGHSYTCAVYYVSDAQKKAAEKALAALAQKANRSPAVAVEPFTVFWPAEEYHQRYAEKHPEAYAEEYELSGRKAFREQRDE